MHGCTQIGVFQELRCLSWIMCQIHRIGASLDIVELKEQYSHDSIKSHNVFHNTASCVANKQD